MCTSYDLNIFYSIKAVIELVGTPLSIFHLTVSMKQIFTIKTSKMTYWPEKELHVFHFFV